VKKESEEEEAEKEEEEIHQRTYRSHTSISRA
jgi:hypothetical protein